MVPYAILAVLIVMTVSVNPATLRPSWLANSFDSAFSLILVAVGQTFTLLVGGFDLSVGGTICVTNSLMAVNAGPTVGGQVMWALISLAIGLGVGAFNGWAIHATGMQPFIVTLATGSVGYGVALLILKIDGGNVSPSFSNALLARFGSVTLSMILTIILVLLWLWFRRTDAGLSLFAVGSDARAAHLNGVRVASTTILAYAVSGGFAALAGIYRTAQVASGSPTAGQAFVILSIAAAVVGGTAIGGGFGGIVGTVVGAFVLRGIADLLVFLRVSSYWSALVQGVLLILAVGASAVVTLRKRGMVAS
ncbi:MAG: ABC transporter permease [Propionibacteriaceae bacterium]|nr:ABC transporter permease [Propionibacteriaceae bacterium]